LALLCRPNGEIRARRTIARWSVLIEHFTAATAARSAGRREGGVMAEAVEIGNPPAGFQ